MRQKLNKSLTLKSGKTCTCCEDALREVSEVLFENSGHSMNITLLQKLLCLIRVTLISSLSNKINIERRITLVTNIMNDLNLSHLEPGHVSC